MWQSYSGLTSGGMRDVLLATYVGDDSNDREIDLGLDYDVIEIRQVSGSIAESDAHLILAHANGTGYGSLYRDITSKHGGMASSDIMFQGKLTGSDSTKIKLGSGGALAYGSNQSGVTYLILGYRLGSGGPAAAVSHVLRRTYTGDGTNNREIDLGRDFHLVTVREVTGDVGISDTHFIEGWSTRDYYEMQRSEASSKVLRHAGGSGANMYFQGKMGGVDATKIKTGTNGNQKDGTNFLSYTYEILAFMFSGLHTAI